METINLNLNISKDKLEFFLQMVNELDFIKNVSVTNDVEEYAEPTKQEVLDNIRRGVEEMKLINQGKLKSRPAKEFLDEL